MSVGRDIAEIILLAGNGATFGQGAKLIGNGAEERVRQAAINQGFIGQAAEVGGGIAGAAGLIKLAGKGLKAAKSGIGYLPKIAPGIERAAAKVAAPLGNTARNNARTRLGMEAIPTISQRAVSAAIASPVLAARAVKAHPFIAGGGALATFANYGMLDNGSAVPTASAAPAAQAAAPAASSATPKYAVADKLTDDIMGAINGVKPGASTYDGMVEQLAASQGGQVSLRQMMAISDVANKIAPSASATKEPNYKNAAFGQAVEELDAAYMARQAAAKKLLATDPAGAQVALDAAFEERRLARNQLLGVEPTLEELVQQPQGQ